MCESCRKLDLRFLSNKTETFYVSVTHLILILAAIVKNKFQQANKTKINHINDNIIEFEVSLHFLGIWPTVRRLGYLEHCCQLIYIMGYFTLDISSDFFQITTLDCTY